MMIVSINRERVTQRLAGRLQELMECYAVPLPEGGDRRCAIKHC